MKNKRGSLVLPQTLFIILNIVFVGILLLHIFNFSTGSFTYEEAYAKQIALLIDEARPDMQILVDFEDGVEYKGSVEVDDETNQVLVDFGESYSFKYFSDYDVNVYPDNDEKLIVINVGDKVWPEVSRPGFGEEVSDEEISSYSDFDKIVNIDVSKPEFEKALSLNEKCREHSDLIYSISKREGVNPLLILALIMGESTCNKIIEHENKNKEGKIVSYDVGLMQINTKNCVSKGLSVVINVCKEQLKDSETNVKTGISILLDSYRASSKGRLFKEACSEEYQKKTYSGWEAALRGYNGWGCYSGGGINSDLYVDKMVKKYIAAAKVAGVIE